MNILGLLVLAVTYRKVLATLEVVEIVKVESWPVLEIKVIGNGTFQ